MTAFRRCAARSPCSYRLRDCTYRTDSPGDRAPIRRQPRAFHEEMWVTGSAPAWPEVEKAGDRELGVTRPGAECRGDAAVEHDERCWFARPRWSVAVPVAATALTGG